jgi:hypothetical protein
MYESFGMAVAVMQSVGCRKDLKMTSDVFPKGRVSPVL